MSSGQWAGFPLVTEAMDGARAVQLGAGEKRKSPPPSASELLDWLKKAHDTTTWAKLPQALVSRTLLLERKNQKIPCLDRFVTRITEIPFELPAAAQQR